MIAYLVVFLVGAGVTFVFTPLVRRFSLRVGAVDRPSDRKVHPVATPTMGGLAMYVGFLAALGVSLGFSFFDEMRRAGPETIAALVTCTLMVGLGVVDDRWGISALTKFVAQIFIAGVMVLMGVVLTFFWLPGSGIVSIGTDLAVPLTILWVVAMVNAVNLVDGLDGLAAGMVAIAAATFFVYMVRSPGAFGDASAAALLSVIIAGICIGFLPWNFHPAKIFMGDSGSLFLGMLMSIATISGAGRNPVPPGIGDLATIAGTLFVPLLVLFIPLLDVLLAVLRRTWRGQGIGHADKQHIHHRLLDIGHSHARAVWLMYLWSVLISGSMLAVGLVDGRLAAGLILAGGLLLFLVTLLPTLSRWRRRSEPPAQGPA